MPLDNEQLRNSLADHAVIVNKGSEKVVKKLDDLNTKKEERLNDKDKTRKTQQEAILKGIKGVEEAVKSQEVAETVSIKNPEAITGGL